MLLLILDQVCFFLVHLLFVPKYPSDDERSASTDLLCVAGQDHEVQEDKIVLMSLDGGARRALRGLRVPTGENRHHCSGQEPGCLFKRGSWCW